jgi:hypothetical protein
MHPAAAAAFGDASSCISNVAQTLCLIRVSFLYSSNELLKCHYYIVNFIMLTTQLIYVSIEY